MKRPESDGTAGIGRARVLGLLHEGYWLKRWLSEISQIERRVKVRDKGDAEATWMLADLVFTTTTATIADYISSIMSARSR
jgi:hypothetical protein